MDRMDVQPILHVEVSITIDSWTNFHCDFDGYGEDDVICKQILTLTHCLADYFTVCMKRP